jgi:hypothetical protein
MWYQIVLGNNENLITACASVNIRQAGPQYVETNNIYFLDFKTKFKPFFLLFNFFIKMIDGNF